MSTLPAWLSVATPRKDIADGSFDESLFAADLGMVDRGRGPADYLDAIAFCEKTYLTDSLRAVLAELARRLSGDQTAAGVYRLQTEFGGGKTHTLLAAYHLFRDPDRVSRTPLVSELLQYSGLPSLPKTRVAVIDGSAIPAGAVDTTEDGTEVHTLLGQLAWRLGGAAAYERVAEQDRAQLGSGTAQLAELLEAYAPCLVLLDETLEYLNKALSVSVGDGNLAATALTVIKELCTAAANVPGAAILATLTSSRLEDYSTLAGEEMQERLSKVVGRSENIVTPVEGDDIFPILHRRLFETVGAEAQRRAVGDAYGEYYESLGDVLPPAFREASYRERIAWAYPFHPELVDILTNRWGSLSGFQRTRGALRTLAHTVKNLAQHHAAGPLIHPGDVDLADSGIRAEVLRFAGESYKAALNSDIIRPDSRAPAEDRRRGGQAQELRIATGLATTAFLNSFGADKVLGASAAQMLTGVGRPEVSRGLIEDVRDALEGSAWYMRLEGGRYRFTAEPTLNKVVMEREGAISEARVRQLVREAIAAVAAGKGPLKVVPRVEESADLPDDPALTLGILDPELRIGPETRAETLRLATTILEDRGGVFRTNKNAALLVAADDAAMRKARATARTLAALREISEDHHRLGRFNKEQREQLDKRLTTTEQRLPQQVVMAYRHLLLLGDQGAGPALEHVDLGPARVDARISDRVLDYLRSADRIAETSLAPAALLAARFGLLPPEAQAVELDELLAYFARLPRVPKLASAHVLRAALAQGVRQGLFGLASGAAWNAPDAVLRFSETVLEDEIHFQPGTYLVRASAIEPLIAERHPARELPSVVDPPATRSADSPVVSDAGLPDAKAALASLRVRIDEVPSTKARELIRAAILPLAKSYADVSLSITITASGGDGANRSDLDLTVLEALRQLGLDHVTLEEL
jgi:hypothetical protein